MTTNEPQAGLARRRRSGGRRFENVLTDDLEEPNRGPVLEDVRVVHAPQAGADGIAGELVLRAIVRHGNFRSTWWVGLRATGSTRGAVASCEIFSHLNRSGRLIQRLLVQGQLERDRTSAEEQQRLVVQILHPGPIDRVLRELHLKRCENSSHCERAWT